MSSFRSDGIDLAIRLNDPPVAAALDARFLFRQEIVAVAAPGLLAGCSDPIDAAALALLPKLHDTHGHWPALLRQCGVMQSRSRDLRVSRTALAIDAALAGQGVALASRFLVASDLEAGRLVQVVPQHLRGSGDFFRLARRGSKRSEYVDAAFHWLVEKAGPSPAPE